MRLIFATLLFRRQPENFGFDLVYGMLVATIVAAWTQWDRRFKRLWQEYRTRNWSRVEGQFDEGEIIIMRRARSKTIAGYQVWFGYEYQAYGDQVGIYTLPRKTEREAEESLKRLANQRVVVRVSPHKASRSHVADKDLVQL